MIVFLISVYILILFMKTFNFLIQYFKDGKCSDYIRQLQLLAQKPNSFNENKLIIIVYFSHLIIFLPASIHPTAVAGIILALHDLCFLVYAFKLKQHLLYHENKCRAPLETALPVLFHSKLTFTLSRRLLILFLSSE